jgi:cell division protein FtsQ
MMQQVLGRLLRRSSDTGDAAAGAVARPTARRAPPPRRRRRVLPLLRRSLPWLLPALFVVAAAAIFGLSRQPLGQALLSQATDRVLAVTAKFGLVVEDIEVEGRETTDAATIMAALAADRGTPILAVSPSRAKQQLEALPWVRSAAIERRLPSTLFVKLVERHPLAVWQHGGKQELIDRHGDVIAVKDLGRFAKLPTVVGDDADKHAAALLDMLSSQPDLAARVTAAVRVDERRWNLRVDNAIDVLLPEEDPAGAWKRLAALEHSDSVLKRDIQTVDLRLSDRVVLRVNGAAPAEAAQRKKPHPAGKPT